LRLALDDDQAVRCGRCDRCGGFDLPTSVSPGLVEAASERLVQPGVPLEARRQWPGGMGALGVQLSGRIPPGEQAGAGRAVARLTDLGWGDQLRALFHADTPDGEVPVPLRHAVVQVLERWDLPERPDGIVVIGSISRPHLVSHLAEGLSKYLRIPLLTRFSIRGQARPSEGAANSAHRLHVVAERYHLEQPESVNGRRVLLIDDRTSTGWSLAVTSRALRRAGAAEVHPLVLATG
jgi:ATP-dependent DNA helicase RecQ